jgi:hypothetical protein
MPRGGKRLGAGRPKGSKNKRTLMLEAGSRQAAVGGFSPLAYLLQIMRDKTLDKAIRLDAAKAAAPYCHPRLSATHSTKDSNEKSHEDWVKEMKRDVEQHDRESQEVEEGGNGALEAGRGAGAVSLINGPPFSVIDGDLAS